MKKKKSCLCDKKFDHLLGVVNVDVPCLLIGKRVVTLVIIMMMIMMTDDEIDATTTLSHQERGSRSGFQHHW